MPGIQNVVRNHCSLSFCSSSDVHTTYKWLAACTLSTRHSFVLHSSLRSFPQIFEQKRDCSWSASLYHPCVPSPTIVLLISPSWCSHPASNLSNSLHPCICPPFTSLYPFDNPVSILTSFSLFFPYMYLVLTSLVLTTPPWYTRPSVCSKYSCRRSNLLILFILAEMGTSIKIMIERIQLR